MNVASQASGGHGQAEKPARAEKPKAFGSERGGNVLESQGQCGPYQEGKGGPELSTVEPIGERKVIDFFFKSNGQPLDGY